MKNLFFSIICSLFFLPLFAQKTDSIEYYSYLDTLKLYDKLVHENHFNSTNTDTKWLYNFYKLNFYAVHRMPEKMKTTLTLLYTGKNKKIINLHSNELTYYYLWCYSISGKEDSLGVLLKKIINSNDYSDNIKVKSLNTASFFYVRKNVSFATKLLNLAIQIGLKDSLPELYHTFLNLSAINLYFNLIRQAENYLNMGSLLQKRNSNPIIDMLYKHNMSTILMTKLNYDSALVLLKEEHYFLKKYNLTEYCIGSTVNIARQYVGKKMLDSSFYYAAKEYDYVEANKSTLSDALLTRYYWLLSDLYSKKNIDSSFFFLRKAYLVATPDVRSALCFDMANLFYLKKNKDSAYYYVKLAYESKTSNLDSLKLAFASENSKKIELLNGALQNKELEVKLLKSEHSRKKMSDSIIYMIITFFLIILSVILAVRNVYFRKVQRLKEKFTQELVEYQEKLNQRVSMELHDNIGQGLLLLSKNDYIQQHSELSQQLLKSINDLREISHDVFPVHLLNFSFDEALNSLTYNTENSSKFSIIKEIDKSINLLSKNKLLHVYRIFQELISNSLKYCNGTIIYFSIQQSGEKYVLEYKDVNEQNQHVKINKGFGINSIILRTKILDGKINYGFNKGFYTKIIFNRK